MDTIHEGNINNNREPQITSQMTQGIRRFNQSEAETLNSRGVDQNINFTQDADQITRINLNVNLLYLSVVQGIYIHVCYKNYTH